MQESRAEQRQRHASERAELERRHASERAEQRARESAARSHVWRQRHASAARAELRASGRE